MALKQLQTTWGLHQRLRASARLGGDRGHLVGGSQGSLSSHLLLLPPVCSPQYCGVGRGRLCSAFCTRHSPRGGAGAAGQSPDCLQRKGKGQETGASRPCSAGDAGTQPRQGLCQCSSHMAWRGPSPHMLRAMLVPGFPLVSSLPCAEEHLLALDEPFKLTGPPHIFETGCCSVSQAEVQVHSHSSLQPPILRLK